MAKPWWTQEQNAGKGGRTRFRRGDLDLCPEPGREHGRRVEQACEGEEKPRKRLACLCSNEALEGPALPGTYESGARWAKNAGGEGCREQFVT